MATDLQDNAQYRLFKELIGESKTVTIASVAMIACLLAVLLSGLAVYSATTAKAKVDYELEATRTELTESKNRTALYIIYVR